MHVDVIKNIILQDCPNGDEEEGCPDYTDIFEKHSGYMLNGSEVEKWLYTPKPTCSIRCVQAKNFVCYSYNYEYVCSLLKSLACQCIIYPLNLLIFSYFLIFVPGSKSFCFEM